MSFKISLRLLTLVLFSFPSFSHSQELIQKNINNIIKGMSLEEKIQQIFVFNIYKSKFSPEYENIIEKHHPGSYILFSKDIKSVKSIYELTSNIKYTYKKSGLLPPFFMIDQEGGNVNRINTRPNLPSALSMGTSRDIPTSQKIYENVSNILGLLGINMNLAPVLDLSDPAKRNFIGNRSYGNDPIAVTKLARKVSKAYISNSVIPTYKHFPGHGGVRQDSHRGLPVKSSSLKQIAKYDLLPYSILLKEFPSSAVMVGHIAFPKIDPSGLPATFSKKLVTQLLREKMKFNGLVLTDDLQMKALDQYGSLSERAVKAFLAGNDLIMVTGSLTLQRKLYKDFKSAIIKNDISLERLNQSLRRIISAKLKLAPTQKYEFKEILPKIKYSISQVKKHSDKIIKKNMLVSSIQSDPQLNLRIKNSENIYVYSAYYSFFNQLKKSFPNKNFVFNILKKGSPPPVRGLASNTKKSFNIYYASGLGTLSILSKLPNSIKKNTVVLNTTHPGAIKSNHIFTKVINVNSPYFYSGEVFSKLVSKSSL